MRIDKVYIKNFKNLRDFSIDLDENRMETVLLGQNATGKSNFIEALVLIFKHLDLERSPPFEYDIEYRVDRNRIGIKVSFSNEKYVFRREKDVSNALELFENDYEVIKRKDFYLNKGDYLPKYVFTYYSGVSNRLKEHFDEHQKIFYDRIIKKDVTESDVDDLRKLFYVQLIHSYFVLLAFYSFEDEEQKTMAFLEDVLGIENLESILFVLQKPNWSKKPTKDLFWGARGLVRQFLDKLWTLSLAPISDDERKKIDFRRDEKQERLYLYVSTKEKLKSLASFYQSNTSFFKALESTYISDLIDEVKVRVKKKDLSSGAVTFKDLSEGEQQLLTVLGLLKFTKDEESLILLDEPDTHLNPLWKWKYREYIQQVVERPESTQIIINTHDPLVIGGLEKEEVRIFRKDETGKIYVEQPEVDPKGLGVAGILTSELFGLPTTLDKETQLELNEKRYLQGKLIRNESLTNEEEEKYKTLKKKLEKLGFYDQSDDAWYSKYLAEISKNELFLKAEFTEEEKNTLEEESRRVMEEILKEEKA